MEVMLSEEITILLHGELCDLSRLPKLGGVETRGVHTEPFTKLSIRRTRRLLMYNIPIV